MARRSVRRIVGAAVAALAVLALGRAPAAWAHGVLRASDPGAGAVVDQAPAAITLSFTEAPELAFSSVKVLDGTGRSFGAGGVQPVVGDPETLTQALLALPRGVYTVSWRIVSRVDGHLTAGSFAFGVQTPVTRAIGGGAASSVSVPGNRSPAAVAGRTLLYLGLACLMGTAWVGALLFGARRRGLVVLLLVGWAAAAVGVGLLGLAQRSTTGASLDVFLQSRLGRSVVWRMVGLGIAGAGVALAVCQWWLWRRRWRAGLGLVAAGALVGIVAHVESGHAASWTMVGLQTVHVVAMAVWIGGLAALLAGLGRATPADEQAAAAAAARRFSAVAAVALGVLVVTGVIRAIDEVGGWRPLVDSGYGQLMLAKGALLVVIAGLGAVNRFRHVPAADRSLTGLRRVGTAEVGVAVVVFVVTGLLTTSPPPATATVTEPAVVVSASDFGTTVRARLTASPGQAGQNRFTVRLTDYDSGAPVTATRVTARFTLPADAAVSPSTLDLPATAPGTFAATGTNLTLPGRWRVTLVIERGADSLELGLDVVTRAPPGLITVTPGPPAIYTVALGQGRTVQVYADPEKPGRTELHATFFSAAGAEEPVDGATVTASGTTAAPRRLGPGHFVADVDAPAGDWPVEVTAVTPAGDYLYAPLTLEIRP